MKVGGASLIALTVALAACVMAPLKNGPVCVTSSVRSIRRDTPASAEKDVVGPSE